MPASYPTTVKTFTTKNAGDIVTPAFVNDLQDEVHAISSALLGGVARLNVGASTLTALSVPGASTLASLQVSSNCTISGVLTANKIVSTSLSQRGLTSYVYAYPTDNSGFLPAYSSNSTYKMRLNGEVADVLGEFDSTTFTFTPKSSGFYRVEATYRSLVDNIGLKILEVAVNDTVAINVATWGWASAQTHPQLAGIVRCASSGAAGAITFRVRASIESSYISGSTASWAIITRLW